MLGASHQRAQERPIAEVPAGCDLWTLPSLWESPVRLEIPTVSWKALRASHSAHRPGDESGILLSRKQDNERHRHADLEQGDDTELRPMDAAGPDGPRRTMKPSSASPTGRQYERQRRPWGRR
jgi:hypothetical protein